MKLNAENLDLSELSATLINRIKHEGTRLSTVTSIDGTQIAALLLNPSSGSGILYVAPLQDRSYPSLSSSLPAAHWFERALHDMFGIIPTGHPRLKPAMLNEFSNGSFGALLTTPPQQELVTTRDTSYLHVRGDDIYEIAVGPVHAGIIEPGHFRFNCLGELIVNLEIRLGFLHRGVEKRLTEVPWQKARFVAEAASSDTAAAHALAHSIAIESLTNIEVPRRAQFLRTLALEIERLAMHIGDVGGMATDVGFLAIASSLSRLRGRALRMAELLTGSRYLRAYIMPGGVREDADRRLKEIATISSGLQDDLKPFLETFIEDPVVSDRTSNVGRVSTSLANDFGFVGVTARASGVAYDTRQHFKQGVFPEYAPEISMSTQGDVFSRVSIRIKEIGTTFRVIAKLLADLPNGNSRLDMPAELAPSSPAAGVVEAFRGELVHLLWTDANGRITRYHIKDPSANNWTALAIAARHNLVADFPICNKSFSLSYSGHDL